MTMVQRTELGGVALILAALVACKNDYDIASEPVDVNPGDVTECDFTPIPDTRMSRYDCNPVFVSTGEDWGSSIGSVGFRAELVMGHPFYQMWYAAYPEGNSKDGNYGLGYAVSGDGVEWDVHPSNPLFMEPKDGGWDRDNMDAIQVLYDDDAGEYVLVYQGVYKSGGKTGLGVYTSDDGVSWDKFNNGEMVLNFGSENGESVIYDGVSYCWPLAFTKNSKGFDGYLGGGKVNNAGDNDVCEIYGFGGDTLETMTLDSSPILEAGPNWYDESGITSAAVVELNGEFYMFYTGFERWTDDPAGGWRYATNSVLNLATSSDGYDWQKHASNPLPVNADLTSPSKGGESYVSSVAAQAVGERIHVWVTDYYPEEDASAVGYFLFEPDVEPHPEE